MTLIDDRFSAWTSSPDEASTSPQWPWQWASAPMLQGTPGLIGAGNLQGFGGLDGRGMTMPSAPNGAGFDSPLPLPRSSDAPAFGATDTAMADAVAPRPATGAPSDPSLFDRLSAAAHNFRPVHQGIIPGMFDAASGLMTGRRLDSAGQAQQSQNQTVAALQSRGLAPDVAEAVARNPALMHQVAAQFFGPKQYQHVVVRDAQGNVVPLTFDAASGQYRDARGNPLPAGPLALPAGQRGPR